jgi:hypothetical protein
MTSLKYRNKQGLPVPKSAEQLAAMLKETMASTGTKIDGCFCA